MLVDPVKPAGKLTGTLHVPDGLAELGGELDETLVMIDGSNQLLEALNPRSRFTGSLFGYGVLSLSLDLSETSTLLCRLMVLFGERRPYQAGNDVVQASLDGAILSVPHGLSAEPLFDSEFEFAGVDQIVRSGALERRRLRTFRGLSSNLALPFTEVQLALLVEHRDIELSVLAGRDPIAAPLQTREQSL
jgi:hypothetical protein